MPVPLVPAVCPLCGPGFSRRVLAIGMDFEYSTTGEQEFSLVLCATCRCILLDPRPADHVISSLYPADYQPYRFDELPPIIRAGRDWVQRDKVRVVERLAPGAARIVDVGCGAGSLVRLLRRYGPKAWRLVGWDYAGPHMLQLEQDGFEVIAGPIDSAHVPTGVDVFILNQVIEHVPLPAEILALLVNALEPGGYLVIETPDVDGLDARLFQRRYWGGYHIPRHMALFCAPALRTLVERCGLSVVETRHIASPAFWVQSIHHCVGETIGVSIADFFSLTNLPLVVIFSLFDEVRSRFGATSNLRLIARKPT